MLCACTAEPHFSARCQAKQRRVEEASLTPLLGGLVVLVQADFGFVTPAVERSACRSSDPDTRDQRSAEGGQRVERNAGVSGLQGVSRMSRDRAIACMKDHIRSAEKLGESNNWQILLYPGVW